MIYIINEYSEPVVSDPKSKPKSTKYLLDREFIYLKDLDSDGFYLNSIRISEISDLDNRSPAVDEKKRLPAILKIF